MGHPFCASDLARQHAMLVAFSKDPALFVHNLARSNARDFQFLHASEQLESENPLQESNPYLDDIVSQYLLQKRLKSEETSKKRQ
jgi:hypothetical protein